MANISKPEIINRDPRDLCPWFAAKSAIAIQDCNDRGYNIAMFEGYRSPMRQDWLYSSGRTRAGKKVTYARAWESFHNFGLSFDPVFFDGRVWSWEGPWDKVHAIFHEHGFETLDFEKSHVEITAGLTHQEAYKIAKDQGLLALWSIVENRYNF